MAKLRSNEKVNILFTTKEHPNEMGGYLNVLRKNIGDVLAEIMRDAKVLDIQHVTIQSI